MKKEGFSEPSQVDRDFTSVLGLILPPALQTGTLFLTPLLSRCLGGTAGERKGCITPPAEGERNGGAISFTGIAPQVMGGDRVPTGPHWLVI